MSSKQRTGVAQLEERRQNRPEVAGSSPDLPYFSSLTRLRHRLGKHFRLTIGERLGRPECPYLRRWTLLLGLFSIRVHHFYRSDDARAFHDHPWWFVTLVLKGGYTDRSDRGDDHLRPGSLRFRPAHHSHTVIVDPGGVWTIILTGPHRRRWGFWQNGKFIKANKWFATHGHHPCDQP